MLKINGKKYPIYTLDFETYYEQSSGYSLRNKRYNTSQYIKDPLFKAHGVGIKKGTGKTRWVTKNIKEELQALPWDKSALLGHNTYFDGLILSHHYGVQPAFLLDTMCMAKAVHGANSKAGLDFLARLHGLEGKVKGASLVNTMGKVRLSATELRDLGEYCKDDCDDTRALFDIFYSHVPDDELRLIDLTVRMFTRPLLRLDVPRAQAEYEKEVREKQEALDYVSSICTLKDLTSNDKFADLLEKHDYPPPMKVSLTTNKPAYAFAKTDLDFIDMQENGPPIIRALCDARVRNKTSTNETRALRFIQEGANNCPIPVMLNYCGAHTFRWSGGNKCLGGDTEITVFRNGEVCNILLCKLLPDDLVWDGGEFVEHGGLLDQGTQEVITYDGLTGTPDHEVYTDCGKKVTLDEATRHSLRLAAGSPPTTVELAP